LPIDPFSLVVNDGAKCTARHGKVDIRSRSINARSIGERDDVDHVVTIRRRGVMRESMSTRTAGIVRGEWVAPGSAIRSRRIFFKRRSTAADVQGSFIVSGTFVREHGGPIREDEMPDAHPALYAGAVTGGVMQLTVHLTATNEVIGTFTLTRGAPGRVVKCL
jgi:hypothetical protein